MKGRINPRFFSMLVVFSALAGLITLHSQTIASNEINFVPHPIPFRLESNETPTRHFPATMAGGVAVFDYDGDGRPDIFFTNGASITTLKKTAPKFRNRLFHNEGGGKFADVTLTSGLAGTGYDDGVAVADYDNDGHPDLFVAGVHQNTLYHNNGDGTFTDVTARAGVLPTDLPNGPEWAVGAAWIDVNGDGLLDLFVVNYVQWNYQNEPVCAYKGVSDYCAPTFYKGLPNRLYINKGGGKFVDASAAWGVQNHIGKGMGAGLADYDGDGRPDLFVTNDGYYNFLFHNLGNKFEEVAFEAGVALMEDGNFISGMGLDFRDFDNDGFPDLAFVALTKQSFPLLKNMRGHEFREITTESGMRNLTLKHAGFGAALIDFDNDGWKDLFVTGGHALSLPKFGEDMRQYNLVFHNLGSQGKWEENEAGLHGSPPARHRGCAFGDFDGDGKVDAVVTALDGNAEILMNHSADAGHWLDIKLEGTVSNRDGIGAGIKITTAQGSQFNHQTSSVGYASSSLGPVHFGLGTITIAETIEISWPSGIRQTLQNIKADQTIQVKEPAR